jgi:hypothetical protein
VRLVGDGRNEVDGAGVELGAQRGQLVVVELVVDCECLQRGLVDRAALLGVLEEGLDRGRKSRSAQLRSLLLVRVTGAQRANVAGATYYL